MTVPKKFVGLHAHTSKSIFDGFGSVEDHFDFVVSNGGDALAITDHGNMNAASDAFQKQTEYDKKGINFNAIYGVEAYFIDDLDKWREEKLARDEQKKEDKEAIVDSSDKEDSSGENEEETKNVSKKFDPINRRKHMVLLAKSQKGLKNLFRIVSKSNRDGFYRYPRVDMKMLREHGEDIVISGACIGGQTGGFVFEEFADTPQDQLSVDLLDDQAKMANIQKKIKNHYDELADAVGEENVFLELQFNKLPVQHMVNRALIEFAKNSKYKLISTADSHYNKPTLWRERELYKLIGRQMRGSKDGINPNALPQNIDELKCELYPKNAEQMWASYQSVKGNMSFYDDQLVADSIERTWDIAHNLIGKVTPDTSIKLPSFGAPPGVDPFTLLVDKCKEGMRKRGLAGNKQYLDRLKRELIVIRDLGFVPYFLTLKAVFECVENRVLMGPGRGSSAASLVNYVLEITDVDPVANDLFFERFLSPARSKQDIADIDCIDSRHLVETPEGYKTISDLTIGDLVLDHEGNPKKVLNTFSRPSEENETIEIIVEQNGTYGAIICNLKHKLLNNEQNIVLAKDIRVGDSLYGTSSVNVVKLQNPSGISTLTDIEVENTHTFRIIPFDVEKKEKKFLNLLSYDGADNTISAFHLSDTFILYGKANSKISTS